MAAKFAAMLLLPGSGQYVGEAATHTETGIVGDGAADCRTIRAGQGAGLAGRLTDGRADASAEAPRWGGDGDTATHRRIDAVGDRSGRGISQRLSAGKHVYTANIGATADRERGAGI